MNPSGKQKSVWAKPLKAKDSSISAILCRIAGWKYYTVSKQSAHIPALVAVTSCRTVGRLGWDCDASG